MQKRSARFTSEAFTWGGQPSPPPSPSPAAAPEVSLGCGGGGGVGGGEGDGDVELKLLCFTSETTLASAAAAEDDGGGGGGGSGNLRNSPDVFGTRAGGGRGIQPPPMLPPPTTGFSKLLLLRWWLEEERENSASSDSHDWPPSADDRVTFSRRHLAYSCRCMEGFYEERTGEPRMRHGRRLRAGRSSAMVMVMVVAMIIGHGPSVTGRRQEHEGFCTRDVLKLSTAPCHQALATTCTYDVLASMTPTSTNNSRYITAVPNVLPS